MSWILKLSVSGALFVLWLHASIETLPLRGAESKARDSGKIVVKATDAKVATDFKVEKGEWLELDAKGKWRMWDKWGYTGALGHRMFKKINATGFLGALIVQIGDGQPFCLVDGFPFEASSSGKVTLWPNRQGYTHLKADGELTITIRTGDDLKDKKKKAQAAAREVNDTLLADPEVKQSLAVLNEARKACGLKVVRLSTALSIGCRKHSRYLVVNKGNPLIEGLKAHEEDKDLKESSDEGARAGKNSVIHYIRPSRAIEGWLATFYHRVPLLQPNLTEVGIGYFQKGANWACGIDCSGMAAGTDAKDVVFYPDDGQQKVPLRFGPEIPSPIPSDHKGSAGFPITIYFTQHQKITKVEVKLLGRNDAELRRYVSTPEAPATSFTQWNTVCVIPAKPLEKGTTYKVELRCTVSGKPYSRTWRFTTVK